MYSKFTFVIPVFFLLLFVSSAFCADPTWVPFRQGNPPDVPQITLLESNDDYVRYRVITSGMWVSDVIGTDMNTYQKLELRKERNDTEIGYPMLPRAPVNLAIPTGSTVSVSITYSNSQLFSGYYVAPYPTFDIDGNGHVIEIYTPDPSTYSTSSLYPTTAWLTRDQGKFRTQETIGVDVHPIRCRLVPQTIEVSDTMEVRVDFNGGVGGALQELGIFAVSARMAFLNYDLLGEPVYNGGMGSVAVRDADEWENNWALYPCDYLIVVPNDDWLAEEVGFLNDVISFASMRASISNFDISIIKLGNAVDPNDGQLDPVQPDFYQPEFPPVIYADGCFGSIREFAKGLYENGDANNTGDGILGFLLLVGDARDDSNLGEEEELSQHDWLIPSPMTFQERIPIDLSHAPIRQNGTDYFYGCLSEALPLDYDEWNQQWTTPPDIAIGRFPVGNAQEMNNIYNKMVTYCLGTTSTSYRNNLLGVAARTTDLRDQQKDWFRDAFGQWTNEINGSTYYGYGYTGDPEVTSNPLPHQLHTDNNEPNPWPDDITWITDKLQTGVGVYSFAGHGMPNYGLQYSYMGPNPSNKLYLMISYSCGSGWIDAYAEQMADNNFRYGGAGWNIDYDGFGEEMTVKSLTGSIGLIVSSRNLQRISSFMFEKVSNSLISEESTYVGQAFLGWQNDSPWEGFNHPLFHYLGDPALDIFMDTPPSVGTDITQNTQWSGQVYVYNSIRVRNNAILEIMPGAEITLLAPLILEDNAFLISAGTELNPVKIHGDKRSFIEIRDTGNAWFWDTKLYDMDFGIVGKAGSGVSMEDCTIRDCNIGAFFDECDFALLEDCEIYDVDYGVVGFYSDVDLTGNHLHDIVKCGIYSMHSGGLWRWNIVEEVQDGEVLGDGAYIFNASNPVLGGNDFRFNQRYGMKITGNAAPVFNSVVQNGNSIQNNLGEAQMYLHQANITLVNSHNNIMSPNDEGILIQDASNQVHDVRFNYFGNPALVNGDRFLPAGYTWNPPDQIPNVYFPIDNPPDPGDKGGLANIASDSLASRLFFSALEMVKDSSYHEAADLFYRIVRTYPNTVAAPMALIHWEGIYRRLNWDANQLIRYINTIAERNLPERMERTLHRIRTDAFILAEQWEEALDLCDLELQDRAIDRMDSAGVYIDIATILRRMNGENVLMDIDAVHRYRGMITTTDNEFLELLTDLGEGKIPDRELNNGEIPEQFVLYACYPNPFNAVTRIRYGLKEASKVKISVFDVNGREVVKLVNTEQQAGNYACLWDGHDRFNNPAASGLYFYTLDTGSFKTTRKMTLVK